MLTSIKLIIKKSITVNNKASEFIIIWTKIPQNQR